MKVQCLRIGGTQCAIINYWACHGIFVCSGGHKKIQQFIFHSSGIGKFKVKVPGFFLFVLIFRAAPSAYGSSQARGFC